MSNANNGNGCQVLSPERSGMPVFGDNQCGTKRLLNCIPETTLDDIENGGEVDSHKCPVTLSSRGVESLNRAIVSRNIQRIVESATSHDVDSRCRAALNRQAPFDIIARLIFDKNDTVRSRIASRYDLDKEMIAILMRDPISMVRHAIAVNPSMDSEVLAYLAMDDDWLVRHGVASNPSSNDEILEILIHDQNELVKLATVMPRKSQPLQQTSAE